MTSLYAYGKLYCDINFVSLNMLRLIFGTSFLHHSEFLIRINIPSPLQRPSFEHARLTCYTLHTFDHFFSLFHADLKTAFQKILSFTLVRFCLSNWSHCCRPFPGFICLSVGCRSISFYFSYFYERQAELARSLVNLVILVDWLIVRITVAPSCECKWLIVLEIRGDRLAEETLRQIFQRRFLHHSQRMRRFSRAFTLYDTTFKFFRIFTSFAISFHYSTLPSLLIQHRWKVSKVYV